jgi:hypothetical protein
MGTTCCCLNPLSSLTATNWIAILGIFVNSALAIWIVRTIQSRLTNKRVLKDHFINEVKEIRNEYKCCLNNLYSNKTLPKTLIPWFKLMNIKVADLLTLINAKYKIDKDRLSPYQRELQELITNNEDFITQFNTDKPVVFTENSRSLIIKFQQEHNHLFNDIIIKINDTE